MSDEEEVSINSKKILGALRIGVSEEISSEDELIEVLREHDKALIRERQRIIEEAEKYGRQAKLRGKHLNQLQGKLYQWNQAITEGAMLAGYSLKYDDPDHDFMTGGPPGPYPSHIEKLIQHVIDTKNDTIKGLLEVLENEIQELHRHIVGLTKALQQVPEALELGPVGNVVKAARDARKFLEEHRDCSSGERVSPPSLTTPYSEEVNQEDERARLTRSLLNFLGHQNQCWRIKNGEIVMYNDGCGICSKASREWEPCPYCSWWGARSNCPKCAKYPVVGWKERKWT